MMGSCIQLGYCDACRTHTFWEWAWGVSPFGFVRGLHWACFPCLKRSGRLPPIDEGLLDAECPAFEQEYLEGDEHARP